MPFESPHIILDRQYSIICPIHGWLDAKAYYEDREIVEMLELDGSIDCPLCLSGIVGECQ